MQTHPQTAFSTETFHEATQALARVQAIYDAGIAYLRAGLQSFVDATDTASDTPARVRAFYPFIRLRTISVAHSEGANKTLSYGFVSGAGVFETTLTRPDLFASYYGQQFELLLQNHGVALEVGVSDTPIPVHFSLAENDHMGVRPKPAEVHRLRYRSMGAFAGDVFHHAVTGCPGCLDRFDDLRQLPLADEEIEPFHGFNQRWGSGHSPVPYTKEYPQ